MSLLRRRMMMQKMESYEYDIEIVDPTDKYGAVRMNVNAGDTFYVEWDINATKGYVYDMRGCGGKYISMIYSTDASKNGKETIVVPKDGHIVFGCIYSYIGSGYVSINDRFNGDYIRAKKI